MRGSDEPFGFLNALKPPGMTSTSFGGWVRRMLRGAPVGHWGTLDPSASGVLVLAVGRATRLLPLVTPSRKQYVFDLRLGTATDTADATGRVVAQGAVPDGWARRLPVVAASLVGPLAQVPPMFSAVKVGGRPLYVSARRGQPVARAPRTTRVLSLRVIDVRQVSARLLVECEAGLYVRTLCEELGTRLGAPAHMGALVRTAAGPFAIAQSWLPADIESDPLACLTGPLEVLHQPRIELDAIGAQRFALGNETPVQPRDLDGRDLDVLVLHAGRLIGIGTLDKRENAILLAPSRVFASAKGGSGAGAKP